MAKRTKAELKALFERGDQPKAQDYADLIDSLLSANGEDWPDPLPTASARNLTDFGSLAVFNPWVTLTGTAGFIDANTVINSGDVTPLFFAGQRARLKLDSGYVYSDVTARSYDGGTDVTTIDLADNVADITIHSISPSLFLPVASGGPVGLGTLGVSPFAATLFDDANAAAYLTTLGLTAFGQSLGAAASASAARALLGLVIDTDVASVGMARLAQLGGPFSMSGNASVDLAASGLATTPYSEFIITLDGVSIVNPEDILIRVGDDAGIKTTGYTSWSSSVGNAIATAARTNSTGFIVNAGATTSFVSGFVTLQRLPTFALPGGPTWLASGTLALAGGAGVVACGGIVNLGSNTPQKPLDRIRMVASAGSNFDAGTVSVFGRQ